MKRVIITLTMKKGCHCDMTVTVLNNGKLKIGEALVKTTTFPIRNIMWGSGR